MCDPDIDSDWQGIWVVYSKETSWFYTLFQGTIFPFMVILTTWPVLYCHISNTGSECPSVGWSRLFTHLSASSRLLSIGSATWHLLRPRSGGDKLPCALLFPLCPPVLLCATVGPSVLPCASAVTSHSPQLNSIPSLPTEFHFRLILV